MNKAELITSMAEKSKLTKKDAELALKALIESVEPPKNRQIFGEGVSYEGLEDYWAITHLIENAHQGEQLETGQIWFGS